MIKGFNYVFPEDKYIWVVDLQIIGDFFRKLSKSLERNPTLLVQTPPSLIDELEIEVYVSGRAILRAPDSAVAELQLYYYNICGPKPVNLIW